MEELPVTPPLRKRSGCLTALGIVALLYIAIQGYQLVRLNVNRALWQSKHLQAYQLDVAMGGMLPIPGPNPLTVRGDVATFADGSDCQGPYCPYLPDRLFEQIEGCIWAFPFTICESSFDPTYGYPTRFVTPSCLIMTDCYMRIETRNLRVETQPPS